MTDEAEASADGGRRGDGDDHVAGVRSYTVRLELVDEPGELLRALQPIADNGGNLLSIFHERGNLTPRGHIPVEVDLECTPDRFDDVVAALRDAGVNVIQAGAEQYSEEMTVLLAGHLIDTDLSDTLNRIEECAGASVADISLSSPEGTADASSARLRLAVESGRVDDVLAGIRAVAEDKELRVIEPLTGGGETA
ncbi:amino acid-binding protein [Halostella salina]|uniref:amino acid-binding protein n=1 Tax=Halostella salina TaxID=1547897 RepID=UPI0035BEC835